MADKKSNMPPIPAAPKKDLPRPFKSGDTVLRRDDTVDFEETHPGTLREVSRAESRITSDPKEYRKRADYEAETGLKTAGPFPLGGQPRSNHETLNRMYDAQKGKK